MALDLEGIKSIFQSSKDTGEGLAEKKRILKVYNYNWANILPGDEASDYILADDGFKNIAGVFPNWVKYHFPLNLSVGSIINSITVYGDDIAGEGWQIFRVNFDGSVVQGLTSGSLNGTTKKSGYEIADKWTHYIAFNLLANSVLHCVRIEVVEIN